MSDVTFHFLVFCYFSCYMSFNFALVNQLTKYKDGLLKKLTTFFWVDGAKTGLAISLWVKSSKLVVFIKCSICEQCNSMLNLFIAILYFCEVKLVLNEPISKICIFILFEEDLHIIIYHKQKVIVFYWHTLDKEV